MTTKRKKRKPPSGFTKRAHRSSAPSGIQVPGTQLHDPLIFLLEPIKKKKHVKVFGREHRCASRHVELRANPVIPPAEEVVITASRTFTSNVESSNDEMI
jgi:hypothetical protein